MSLIIIRILSNYGKYKNNYYNKNYNIVIVARKRLLRNMLFQQEKDYTLAN